MQGHRPASRDAVHLLAPAMHIMRRSGAAPAPRHSPDLPPSAGMGREIRGEREGQPLEPSPLIALTHDAGHGASTPMLMAKSCHDSEPGELVRTVPARHGRGRDLLEDQVLMVPSAVPAELHGQLREVVATAVSLHVPQEQADPPAVVGAEVRGRATRALGLQPSLTVSVTVRAPVLPAQALDVGAAGWTKEEVGRPPR